MQNIFILLLFFWSSTGTQASEPVSIKLSINPVIYEHLGTICRVTIKNTANIDFEYQDFVKYELYQNDKLIGRSPDRFYSGPRISKVKRIIKANEAITYFSMIDFEVGNESNLEEFDSYFKNQLQFFTFSLVKGNYSVRTFLVEKGSKKVYYSNMVKFDIIEHPDQNERKVLKKLKLLQDKYTSGITRTRKYNDDILGAIYTLWLENKSSVHLNTIGLDYLTTYELIDNMKKMNMIFEITGNAFNLNPYFTDIIIRNIKVESNYPLQSEYNKKILERAQHFVVYLNTGTHKHLNDSKLYKYILKMKLLAE
ncbi:MAG: hypothetical protein J0L62_17270 [Bacteroidetes bacterium]|nr:hypothetical protein [Bacteroidota bacterium]